MTAWVPRVLLLLLVPIYGAYLLSPAYGYCHDDGLYLVTSRALAGGLGYIVQSLPTEPPMTKYPILYPALLAVIWKVAVGIVPVVLIAKLLSLSCMIGWLLVVRLWASDLFEDRSVLDWVTFFVACSPWTPFLSTAVLPDTLFALISTSGAYLLAGKDPVNQKSDWKWIAGAALLAGSAFLLRTTGLALILAGTLVLLARKPRNALMFLTICGLVCAPWLIWQASQAAPSDMIQLYYSKASYAKGHILSGYSLREMFTVFYLNALLLAAGFVSGLQVFPAIICAIIGLLAVCFAVQGWYSGPLPKLDAMATWLVLYTGILLCWAWPPQRYMIPVVPIFLVFLALGLSKLQWIRRHGKIAVMVLALIGFSDAVMTAANAQKTLEVGTPILSSTDGERWSEYKEISTWIVENTPKDAVLVGNLDPVLYLNTGRKALKSFPHRPYDLFYQDAEPALAVGSSDDMRNHLKNNRVNYVVVTPMEGFREGGYYPQLFSEFQQKWPEALHLVKQFARPGYSIFEVNQGAL